ncbi:MAG: hypothetical protein N2504_00030 [candidate division WOR-3 bacterium]|nr:hypothetical protein [candidate division WOR-3 bacterium]MCX7946967.1 hypothetical protein [candidate division WOR-3 bacterium]MDW8149992.1 hypothetical protein [candidate division WOR-3 bacterium]
MKKDRTIKDILNVVKKLHYIYRKNEKVLDEVVNLRNEILRKFSHIETSKLALLELEKLERSARKLRKTIKNDKFGFRKLFTIVLIIFKIKNIKEYRDKEVHIWLEDNVAIHFDFKDGSVSITKDGEILIL